MRRVLQWTAAGVGGFLALAALLGALLLLLANTDAGRRRIEALTSRLSGGSVQISGLDGEPTRELRLARLQLRDDRGVWLEAEQILLRWSPLALLAGTVHIDSLEVARLHIERAPQPAAGAAASTPWWSRVPAIDLDRALAKLELGAPLAGTAATLNLHAAGRWRSLEDARLDAGAQRIDAPGDYALAVSSDFAHMSVRVLLHEPANGTLENLLGIPGLGPLSAALTLTGPRALEELALTVDAGELHGRATGMLDLRQRSADLDYSLASPALQLRPDLRWDRLALQGRWHGTLEAAIADGRLQITGLQLPGGTALAALDADLKAADGSIAAHAVGSGVELPGQRQLLRADPLTVDAAWRPAETGRPLTLTASHRLFLLHAVERAAAVTFDARLPDLEPFARLGGTELRGSATLQGRITRERRAWRLGLTADTLLGAGPAWLAAFGPRATLAVTAALAAPGYASLEVDSLQLNGAAASLALSGKATRTATAVPPGVRVAGFDELDAQWRLTLRRLQSLSAALAGRLDASGSVHGRLDALSGEARLGAALSVRGSPTGNVAATLQFEDMPRMPRGSLAAHGDLDGAPLSVDLDLRRNAGSGTQLHVGQAAWKSARATGDLSLDAGDAASGRVHLRIDRLADLSRLLGAPLDGSLTAEMALLRDRGRDVLTIADLAGDIQGITINSLAPARLVAAGGLSIENFRLAVGGKLQSTPATLQMDGRLSPLLDLHASLTGVGPPLVNHFVPNLLGSGALHADARLGGTPDAPQGRIDVQGSALRLSAAADSLPALDLHAAAQIADQAATLNVRLAAAGGSDAAGSSSALTLTGRAPLRPDGVLDLTLGGRLDAELLNPLLEAAGQHASGRIDVNGTVGGRWTAPHIEGSLRIVQGVLRDYGRGFALTDIAGTLNAREDSLQIESLTARAGPGTVSVTGTIGVLEAKVPLNLAVTASNARPLVSKLFTATLDGNVSVTGTAAERLKVAGRVRLNRATVGIPSSFPPNVAVLDVRRTWQHAAPATNPLIIDFDVAVQAPGEFMVKGRGLDAELGGEVHLSGTSAQPQVSGGFDLRRGSFDLAGRRLDFTDGSVRFDGADLQKRIDPTLDFTAQTALADSTATLRITGRADAPRVDISSSPPLPTDEIMARLLFGENAAQLTALQLAQVGASVAAISGLGGDGLNPLVKLQETLGLDRLSVGSAAGGSTAAGAPQNNATSIEAGRYLSKRVYLEARQTSTGASQLQADVTLTKHLKLQTRLGNGTALQGTTPENDPGSSIGLSYTLEY